MSILLGLKGETPRSALSGVEFRAEVKMYCHSPDRWLEGWAVLQESWVCSPYAATRLNGLQVRSGEHLSGRLIRLVGPVFGPSDREDLDHCSTRADFDEP